jgi:hypothetical protein
MGQEFSAADFDKWVPAQQALTQYLPLASDHAAADLVNRLAEGLMVARAENFIVVFGQPKLYGPERPVPAYLWKAIADRTELDDLSLWSTGAAEANIFPDGTLANPVPHKLFGVRFDPAEIARLTATLPFLSPAQPKRRPPPVTGAALKAWYEAYTLAYGEERTADHAWACAKGAFPGRAVPRAEVRDLLLPGKPGPKGGRAYLRRRMP